MIAPERLRDRIYLLLRKQSGPLSGKQIMDKLEGPTLRLSSVRNSLSELRAAGKVIYIAGTWPATWTVPDSAKLDMSEIRDREPEAVCTEDPFKPTKHPPGSEGKILILMARYEHGIEPFMKGDAGHEARNVAVSDPVEEYGDWDEFSE